MAESFQQQSFKQKLTYFGVIVLLFFVIVLFRGMVNNQAKALEIREENLGEVELTGSALQLSLTGSRGLAICALWQMAIDRQTKHEWNELELLVNSLTKLQPHFITPWLFQSWNLAYNVSVESDRVKDKFFYVTRGIELLGEGERRNRDSPDLRMNIGWYYQNKFGMSDENNTFRSLFQMSCIDPKERAPERFRRVERDQVVVDYDAFESFCREQPILVRRLRDRLRCDTPDKVLEFLEDNRRIPGRFEENPDLVAGLTRSPHKPPEQRFPLFPPQSKFEPTDYNNDSALPFDTDNFDAARAWMGFAQDPIEDPVLRRRPRNITLVIVQGYPARAQAYRAEYLEKAGWFDVDGWEIRDWFPRDKSKSSGARRPIVVGEDRPWAAEAWRRAFELFERHGNEHGLLLSPAQVANLDPSKRRDYEYFLNVSNYMHFYNKAKVEMKKDAIAARKAFYKAEELRRMGDRDAALRMYEDASAYGPPSTWAKPSGWKKVFADNPEFRADSEEQNETYETQLKYLRLVEERRGLGLKALLAFAELPAQLMQITAPSLYRPSPHMVREFLFSLTGPFDGVDAQGNFWIAPHIVAKIKGEMSPRSAPSLGGPAPPPSVQPGN